jgi:hypothetical protein
MGSLFIERGRWLVVVPSIDGPQHYGTGGEIAMWESQDRGENWRLIKQITVNSPRNHCYMRRPLAAADPFYIFWADGNADSLSISKLYFSDSMGEIRQLPYEMANDFEKPFRVPLGGVERRTPE